MSPPGGPTLDINPPTPVRSNQAVEFLRVVQQHHIQLSSMADFKANVLLGASFLIFSTSLKEVHDGRASLPLLFLMTTAFLAATLVVLAMLPATKRAHDPAPNLLFFGVFAGMTELEFQHRMDDLLMDETKLQHAMMRDIYQLGSVLQNKKYRRLGQAYQVFFVGLMASGAVIVAQFALKAVQL